jgi:hypothetical protein
MKAVITGDIIQSTRMPAVQRDALVKSIQQALKIWEKDFHCRSEFFRGDSFQCYLPHPHDALRLMLLLKTYIRSLNPSSAFTLTAKKNRAKSSAIVLSTPIIDARMALGIGEAEAGRRLATSAGVAFELSGHLLDDLKSRKQTLGIATGDDFAEELETEAVLLDALLSRASALQCEVLSYKLLGHHETAIAKALRINQSAVNQRSKAGNWNAIEAMVNRYENIYSTA